MSSLFRLKYFSDGMSWVVLTQLTDMIVKHSSKLVTREDRPTTSKRNQSSQRIGGWKPWRMLLSWLELSSRTTYAHSISSLYHIGLLITCCLPCHCKHCVSNCVSRWFWKEKETILFTYSSASFAEKLHSFTEDVAFTNGRCQYWLCFLVFFRRCCPTILLCSWRHGHQFGHNDSVTKRSHSFKSILFMTDVEQMCWVSCFLFYAFFLRNFWFRSTPHVDQNDRQSRFEEEDQSWKTASACPRGLWYSKDNRHASKSEAPTTEMGHKMWMEIVWFMTKVDHLLLFYFKRQVSSVILDLVWTKGFTVWLL